MSDLEKIIGEAAAGLQWPKRETEKILERIAADLVMVSVDDLPELAKLHDSFMEFVEFADEKDKVAAEVAKNCADYVERIVLNDVDDKQKALDTVGEAISGIQQLIRDLRQPSEVDFPKVLAPAGVAAGGGDGQETAESEITGNAKEEKAQQSKTEESSEDDDEQELTVDLQDADTALLADFINEANEHCTTAEEMLMELEGDVTKKDAIDAIFRSFHTIKGAAGFLELSPISVLAHESETLLDMARKGSVTIEGAIADIIFDSIDVMRDLLKGVEKTMNEGGIFDGKELVIGPVKRLQKMIADPENTSEQDKGPKIGEVLVDMGAVEEDDVNEALSSKAGDTEKLGETLVRQGKVNPKAIEHALRDQNREKKEKFSVKEMVKIDTERLDRLVDTIGELVIAESMVGQDEEILAKASTKMSKNISHLNKITRELQEMGMAMRLVPVKATFQKLARAVRDLARKSKKKVNLELIGEDSEVDRSIVENIGDPLMHMIRNSIDHGLETPEDRVKAGKSEEGTVWLKAFHKGGNIYFEIEDDGRGLDKERILAKAAEKGLLPPNKDLTDKEIYNLILQPGFSTAQKITDISGRGVGMDVVKKNIEAMRGHLEIESEAGKGTKFSMKLPLTLAIIDGMLVSVGREKYIVPTLSVVESLQLTSDIVSTVNEKYEMINLRGNMLPLFRVRDLFNLPPSDDESADSTVVIIDDMEHRVGLVVDKLLGQRQTVIKSLGAVFEEQKWISGGAILSDGNIGLIIDVGGIISLGTSLEIDYSRRKKAGIPDDMSVPVDEELVDTSVLNELEGEGGEVSDDIVPESTEGTEDRVEETVTTV